ncbi:AfsR/SARP family transcriptional regulator [Streptomyces sp. NPDC047097]|uniref:AfsR/SARP family transcriptional regulator n=1 Tax=Streptomyces sp. NPDC047097 TaxID=3155260 RepID=UPI0033E1A30D
MTVLDRGTDRAPSAPKQRQMLALLLLNANYVVSMSQFVEELWEYNPPPSAVAAVHTYVMQLRRTLHGKGPGAAGTTGRLETRDQGYLLHVHPGELDLDLYETQVQAARHTLEDGDLAEGARMMRGALDMWRGQILADVPVGPLLQAALAVIERNRLDAVVRRIHTDLHLGRHHELIGELSALVHQHPGHEALTAQLMLALYRSGRQADAIAIFHRLRRDLREELGATPCPRLQQLNADILVAHPRLESPSGAGSQLSLDLLDLMAHQALDARRASADEEAGTGASPVPVP